MNFKKRKLCFCKMKTKISRILKALYKDLEITLNLGERSLFLRVNIKNDETVIDLKNFYWRVVINKRDVKAIKN